MFSSVSPLANAVRLADGGRICDHGDLVTLGEQGILGRIAAVDGRDFQGNRILMRF